MVICRKGLSVNDDMESALLVTRSLFDMGRAETGPRMCFLTTTIQTLGNSIDWCSGGLHRHCLILMRGHPVLPFGLDNRNGMPSGSVYPMRLSWLRIIVSSKVYLSSK